MTAKTAASPVKRTNPRAKGLKPVMVRLEPAQLAAVKREAIRRARR